LAIGGVGDQAAIKQDVSEVVLSASLLTQVLDRQMWTAQQVAHVQEWLQS